MGHMNQIDKVISVFFPTTNNNEQEKDEEKENNMHTYKRMCIHAYSVFVSLCTKQAFVFWFTLHSVTMHVANDAHVNKRAFGCTVWPLSKSIVNNCAVISHRPNGFGYGNEAGVRQRGKQRVKVDISRAHCLTAQSTFSFQSI